MRRSAPARGSPVLWAVLGVALLVGTGGAAGAAPSPATHARFVRPLCYPGAGQAASTWIRQGTVGNGSWRSSYDRGTFRLPGREWARSTGSGASDLEIRPYLRFGAGRSGACLVPGTSTTTTLDFRFVNLSWTTLLVVRCPTAGAVATAGYSVNVTADLYNDSGVGSWVVNRLSHQDRVLGNLSVSCTAPGTIRLGPTVHVRAVAWDRSGGTRYPLGAGDDYFYFAQPFVDVRTRAAGGGTAFAEVGNVSITLASARCPGC